MTNMTIQEQDRQGYNLCSHSCPILTAAVCLTAALYVYLYSTPNQNLNTGNLSEPLKQLQTIIVIC